MLILKIDSDDDDDELPPVLEPAVPIAKSLKNNVHDIVNPTEPHVAGVIINYIFFFFCNLL